VLDEDVERSRGSLAEDIASRGYVVVVVMHPHGSSVKSLADNPRLKTLINFSSIPSPPRTPRTSACPSALPAMQLRPQV
jgi:hypothetical protein